MYIPPHCSFAHVFLCPSFSLAVALLVFTLAYIAPMVGMSFFPNNDRGEFIVKIEYPTDYNIQTTVKRTLSASRRIRALPHVLATSSIIGKVAGTIGRVSEGVHLAEITVKTTDKRQRSATLEDMRGLLRREFRNDTDCLVTVSIPSAIGGTESEIELQISGYDLKILDRLGQQIEKLAEESGWLTDIETSVRIGKPQVKVIPKRSILKDWGLNEQLLGVVLRGNIEGIKAGTYKIGARTLDIRVQMERRSGTAQLCKFPLIFKDGKPMHLENVADLQTEQMPIQIVRAEKQRSVKLYANMMPGAALGDAVAMLNKKIKAILPAGYEHRFVGRVEAMGEAQSDFGEAFITATLLLYFLIAAVMESWRQPLIILTTLPMALIGLFWMLFFVSETMSIMGLLGTMMLIGIAVNDAILIMENVKMLRAQQNLSPREAMLASVREKFRSVVMTSIAAILGIAPMAFGQGLGCEMRNSCGVTVIGGLVTSTLLTLYIIPLLYIRFVKE